MVCAWCGWSVLCGLLCRLLARCRPTKGVLVNCVKGSSGPWPVMLHLLLFRIACFVSHVCDTKSGIFRGTNAHQQTYCCRSRYDSSSVGSNSRYDSSSSGGSSVRAVTAAAVRSGSTASNIYFSADTLRKEVVLSVGLDVYTCTPMIRYCCCTYDTYQVRTTV